MEERRNSKTKRLTEDSRNSARENNLEAQKKVSNEELEILGLA